MVKCWQIKHQVTFLILAKQWSTAVTLAMFSRQTICLPLCWCVSLRLSFLRLLQLVLVSFVVWLVIRMYHTLMDANVHTLIFACVHTCKHCMNYPLTVTSNWWKANRLLRPPTADRSGPGNDQIIIMEICNALTLWLKALTNGNVTHIMYIKMENFISNLIKKKLTHDVDISTGPSITMWKIHTHTLSHSLSHTHTHTHTHRRTHAHTQSTDW